MLKEYRIRSSISNPLTLIEPRKELDIYLANINITISDKYRIDELIRFDVNDNRADLDRGDNTKAGGRASSRVDSDRLDEIISILRS